MKAQLEPDASSSKKLHGGKIIDAIKDSGVRYVVSVPDNSTSEGLLGPLAKGNDPQLIRVCKEDETVGICAGLSYCDIRAVSFIQQTGLLYSMNAIRGVAVLCELPICFMVGMIEKEPDVPSRESAIYTVRIIPPLLDVMGIKYIEIDCDEDVELIRPAIDEAYALSRPVVFLIARSPLA
jgi:sulfopyruvate decarboxylase subunit alpha